MTVGRPRKIEPDVILENAMQVFWEKGYDGASMVDIMAATGMHKGSLYQTFGDKKALFLAALERYLDNLYATKKKIINETPDPSDAVRAVVFHMLSSDSDCSSPSNGCMAVNTLVESAPFDDDIADLLKLKHMKMTALMVECISRVEQSGNTRLTTTPEMASNLIFTTMCGLSTTLKNKLDANDAYELLDQQLKLIGI